MAIVPLMAMFLISCTTLGDRFNEAAGKEADASLVGQAIGEASKIPPLPDDCRKRERSGVKEGDRLDVALVQTDNALGRANARVSRCAGWHDSIRNEGGGT